MSDTYKRKRINLGEVRFKFANHQPELPGDIKLFPHQKEFFEGIITDLNQGRSRFYFLQSMTGSGKTIANIMPAISQNRNILITYPTNQLIRDQKTSIELDAGNDKFSFDDKVKVKFLNARHLQREKQKRGKVIPDLIEEKINNARQDDSTASIFLTNPDTLYNILAAHYWKANDFSYPMDRAHEAVIGSLDYFVFDEFHMYDISSETSILNMCFLLHHNKAVSKPIIFSSATSDDDFKERLAKISKEEVREIDDHQSRDEEGEVRIAGDIELEIILGEKWKGPRQFLKDREKKIRSIKNSDSELTAIFESVKHTTKVIDQLKQEFGLSENKNEISYKTGLGSSNNDLREGQLKIGTQTLSVGIDFDTRNLFFESYRARDFLQKLGRVGREGRSATATCFTSEYSFPGLEQMKSRYQDRYQFQKDIVGEEGNSGAMEGRNKLWKYPQRYGYIELGNFKEKFALNLDDEIYELSNKIYYRSPRSQNKYRSFVQQFRDPGTPQVAVATKNDLFFQDLIRFLEQRSFEKAQHDDTLEADKNNFIERNKKKNPVNAYYIKQCTVEPVLMYDFSSKEIKKEMHSPLHFILNNDIEPGLKIYPKEFEGDLRMSSSKREDSSMPKQLKSAIAYQMEQGNYLIYVMRKEEYENNRGLIPHLFRTYRAEGLEYDYMIAFGQNALKLEATMNGK